MAQIETWYNQDLQQAVKVHYIDGNVFSADNNGNIVGVNVFDGGEPATLGGTVSASIIRADGATVAATGTLSGNKVSVALPQSAYAVPGVISIVLKLTSGTTVTTVLAVVGNVYQSTTDTVVDPGTIIPDINTLIAEIEAAVASIPADYSSLWTSLAPAYSTSGTYAVGQYVTYNGGLYRCTTSITSGESWTAAHWTQVSIGNDVSDLKSAMLVVDDKIEYNSTNEYDELSKNATSGYIVDSSGAVVEIADSHFYVSDFISAFENHEYAISLEMRYFNTVVAFYDSNSNNLGRIVSNVIAPQSANIYVFDKYIFNTPKNCTKIRIAFYGNTQADGKIYDVKKGFRPYEEIEELPDLFDEYVVENSYEKKEEVSATITNGYLMNSNGEEVAATSDYNITNKVNCEPGATYYLNLTMMYSNTVLAFFDSNNNVIETVISTQGTLIDTNKYKFTDYKVIAPSNAVKMRMDFYRHGAEIFKVEIVTGYGLIADVKEWVGKKWVCVGDSLTEVNTRATKRYCDYVAEETGITVVNMGDSGTGYARQQVNNRAFYQRILNCPTDADVITIFGSWNDLGAGIPVGSVTDTDNTTIAGCINKTLDNLYSVITLANVGIVAPCPWETTQPPIGSDYFNVLKGICERRSVPFLDLWHGSGLRPWDADFRAAAYTRDGGSGTHPDENGHKLLAPKFESFLDFLLLH